jgi:glycosyltransferase involved in cell wall biosynthesis
MNDVQAMPAIADGEARPRFTLITICWNSADTIGDTLRSIDRQDFRDFEHLVIDGKSSDATLDILEQLKSPVRKVFSEPDKGIYDAMNKGLARSRGEIIGFLNADDVLASDDVLSLIDRTFRSSGADSTYGDLVYVSRTDLSKVARYWKSNPFEKGSFRKGWCPPHPTFYVKRSVYERAGVFDRSYSLASDVELMMRFLEKERISSAYIPAVLVRMRLGGVTNKSIRNIYLQNRQVLRALAVNGLKVTLPGFILPKAVNRLGQFLRSRFS